MGMGASGGKSGGRNKLIAKGGMLLKGKNPNNVSPFSESKMSMHELFVKRMKVSFGESE